MQNSSRMCKRHRFADPLKNTQAIGQCIHSLRKHIKPLTFDELHRVENAAISQRPRIMHGNDSGMLESRKDVRFAEKARAQFAALHRTDREF